MNILQLHFLSSVLHGRRELAEEDAVTRSAALGLDDLTPPFLVAEVAPFYLGVKAEERDRLIRDCADFVGHYLKKNGFSVYYIVNEYDNVQVIITHGDEREEGRIEEIFIDLRNRLQLQFELDSFVGIGSLVRAITELSASAREASEMLAYKYSYSEQGVGSIKNLVRFSHSPNYASNIRFDRVIGCFQDGDIGRMAKRLDELISEIRGRPNVSGTAIQRTFIELTVSVLHAASNADVNVEEILHGLDVYRWIMEQQHTEALTEWFIRLCEELHAGMRERFESTEKTIIQIACRFIDENIDKQDLGLVSVSGEVGLSSFYFSKLFKREKGIGLNNYISVTRVDLAKKMLEDTDLPLAEIARQTGFSTAPYFSQVFKKTTGRTPGEYRRTAAKKL